MRCGTPGPGALILRLLRFPKRFQFRKSLEVLIPSSGSLGRDQVGERQDGTLHSKGLLIYGIGPCLIVSTNARHLAQEINVTEISGQSEVQTTPERLSVPKKR